MSTMVLYLKVYSPTAMISAMNNVFDEFSGKIKFKFSKANRDCCYTYPISMLTNVKLSDGGLQQERSES